MNEYETTIGIYKIYRVCDSSYDECKQINSPVDAAGIATEYLKGLDQENLIVLLLNTRNRVVGIQTIVMGSVNSAQVRLSEVFRPAILANCPAIIIAHNHPSGDTKPSPDDVALTRALVEAGKLLDIEVLDHIIVSDMSQHVSLKEKRLGF